MAYSRPNAFVSIELASPSAPILTPNFYPAMVAPHFQVEYQRDVTGVDYDSRAIEDIPYPGLGKQSIDTNSDLSVDVGDLTANANDATGSPNTERFDPDVFIIETITQSRVDISLAELLHVKTTGFTLPANLRWTPSTGAYKDTLDDVADGDMAAATAAAWAAVSTTNDPVLAKDNTAGIPYGSNAYALKVTLDGTPEIADGVESSAVDVTEGEIFQLKAFIKAGAGITTGLTLTAIDAVSKATIGTPITAQTNTEYGVVPLSIDVIVPPGTGQIAFRVTSDAADAGGIFYVGDATFYYTDGNEDKLSGTIQVSYRALEEKYSGARLQKLEAGTLDDLIAYFGVYGMGPANPLGYMMYNAWVHSSLVTRGVAVGNPASDDGSSTYTGSLTDEILAYTASLNFMNQKIDDYYSIALGTWNEGVWDVFKADVGNQEATNRHWRRMMVNGEISTTSTFRRGDTGKLMGMISDIQGYAGGALVDGDILTYNGVDYTIRVVSSQPYVALPFGTNQDDLAVEINADACTIDFTIEDGANVTQLFTQDGENFTASGYKKVKINDNLVIGTETFLTLGVYPTALIVEHASGAEVAAGLNKTYSMFRYITIDGTSTGRVDKTTLANTAAARAVAYGEERMVIVLPEWFSSEINSSVTDVEGWYLAAQFAAELCWPSAPASNRGPGFPVGQGGFTTLRDSKSNDFKSVRYFNETQLDIIAGGGNSIIENSEPDLVLSCRHSLTTDMSSIEYQEIMLGTARDYVAYSFRDTMQGLIKKVRIEGSLGSSLKSRLEGLKKTLIVGDRAVADITITSIVNGSTADAVTVSGEITHIYPLNRLDMNLLVVEPIPFTVSL